MRIPIAKPEFGPEELEALKRPLETGMVVQGREVLRFEGSFAAFTKSPFAVACTSGSSALTLALAALEVGPSDEILVPAFTWISTCNAALMLGATPILCDIDLKTFNLDFSAAACSVTRRTKVALPVHLFGNPVDVLELQKVVQSAADLFSGTRIRMVEDAACGFGAKNRGSHVGTQSDIGCFSFHPRKAITTGEGGMMTTGSPEYAAILRSLRSHGMAEPTPGADPFLLGDFCYLGWNARMTDLQGAIGQAQLERADDALKRRRELARRYDEAFADLDWLQLPTMPSELPQGSLHGYQSYVCLYQPSSHAKNEEVEPLSARRNAFMRRLDAAGIATRQGTHAVHLTSLYRRRFDFKPSDFPNAYRADRLSVALPLYPTMTDDEQAYVIEHVRKGP